MSIFREPSSFRDRSGFIFYENGSVFRAIDPSYQLHFDRFIDSGLYQSLVEHQLIIPHEEVTATSTGIYKTLQVPKIPFISYPYEWCFQQLKDAALLTLQIQMLALKHGMTLKDASAFNVQFMDGRPVFIDTLSFEQYEEGEPWTAYRQFCTHFLAPLSLLSRSSIELNRLSQLFIDGIPLSLTSKLLPRKTKWSPFFQMHVHYHAKLESRYSGDADASKKVKLRLSKTRLIAIIQHLQSGIGSLGLPVKKTEWSDYYQEFSYSDTAIEHKQQLVRSWVEKLRPVHAWDLGCNTGMFSEIIRPFCKTVTAFDIDHLAIERFYNRVKSEKIDNVLPLVLDLSNPTPAIGWGNQERKSITERGPADLVMALALVHHLCIGNNVPLKDVAEYFSRVAQSLIIEFVPKDDIQTQRLLVTKEDVFADYTIENFEFNFGNYFKIESSQTIEGTDRMLYLMTRR